MTPSIRHRKFSGSVFVHVCLCVCLFMCVYTVMWKEARDQSQVLFSAADTLFLKIESLIGTSSSPSRLQQVPGITCWGYKHAPSCRATSQLGFGALSWNLHTVPQTLIDQAVYLASLFKMCILNPLEYQLCCKYHDTILPFWARTWESLWKRSPFHPRRTCSHPLLQCSELE